MLPALVCARRPHLPRSFPRSTLRRCHGARPGSGWSLGGSMALSATRTPGLSTPTSDEYRLLPGLRSGDGKKPPTCTTKNCPRPLVRLRSSHLHAVHVPPINPVIFRGSYLLTSEKVHLEGGFPLRCFQRLSRPNVATQLCRFPDNWHTSGSSSPVLSY